MIACLQTIDIGRLTSDPLFLIPGGFIAVTGQGPLDSGESSKSTFEAALSRSRPSGFVTWQHAGFKRVVCRRGYGGGTSGRSMIRSQEPSG